MAVSQTQMIRGYQYNGETKTFNAQTTVENLMNVLRQRDPLFADANNYNASVVDGILVLSNRTGSKA